MSIDTITTTIADLEDFWGSARDEWDLLGPADMTSDEQIRFSRRNDEWSRSHGWALERHDGCTWYVASDARFDSEDVPGGELADAIATNDVEDIASALDDTPVDYSVDRSVPAHPTLKICGYATLSYSDHSETWLVHPIAGGCGESVNSSTLLADLLDVIEMAQKAA